MGVWLIFKAFRGTEFFDTDLILFALNLRDPGGSFRESPAVTSVGQQGTCRGALFRHVVTPWSRLDLQ